MNNCITTSEDIRKLGTILSVWAHPDDESFSCGGIMAAATSNGQRVICVTATKGEAGIQDESRWPANKLGEIRANEMMQACKVLGITEHHWLDYADGECSSVPEEEGVARIRSFIEKYKPDSILTFGPEGMTGHPDHRTVSRWAEQAAQGTDIKVFYAVENENAYNKYFKDLDKQFNIYFKIDKPPVRQKGTCDIAFCLTPELIKKKHAALAAMPSQMERLLNALGPEAIDEVFECECYIRAKV